MYFNSFWYRQSYVFHREMDNGKVLTVFLRSTLSELEMDRRQ